MTTALDTYNALAEMRPHTRANSPEGIEHYAEFYPAFVGTVGTTQGYARTFESLIGGWPLFSVPAFFRWMREQALGPWEPSRGPVVTTGNEVEPIGPDHPDWPRWWAQLRRFAEREGYLSYYDDLAEAMGGDRRRSISRYCITIEFEAPADQDHETMRQDLANTLRDTALTDFSIRVESTVVR